MILESVAARLLLQLLLDFCGGCSGIAPLDLQSRRSRFTAHLNPRRLLAGKRRVGRRNHLLMAGFVFLCAPARPRCNRVRRLSIGAFVLRPLTPVKQEAGVLEGDGEFQLHFLVFDHGGEGLERGCGLLRRAGGSNAGSRTRRGDAKARGLRFSGEGHD